MTRSTPTRDKLLSAARAAFWSRGYSNVSLRDIARAAGVDVALVSRYFGGKLGLFEATLEGAFDWPELASDDPVGVAVRKFSDPDKDAHQRSVLQLILMNAADPEVGPFVRKQLELHTLSALRARLGGEAAAQRTALFVAAILGMAMVRQNLDVRGLSDAASDDYARQLRHMIDAALAYQA